MNKNLYKRYMISNWNCDYMTYGGNRISTKPRNRRYLKKLAKRRLFKDLDKIDYES